MVVYYFDLEVLLGDGGVESYTRLDAKTSRTSYFSSRLATNTPIIAQQSIFEGHTKVGRLFPVSTNELLS